MRTFANLRFWFGNFCYDFALARIVRSLFFLLILLSGTSETFAFASAVAAPNISPATGNYAASQVISISDSVAGVEIHYTTDGSAPSASSAVYNTSFALGNSKIVRAIAIKVGYSSSAIAQSKLTVITPAPVISPAAGQYTSQQQVGLTCSQANATIYYTVNGSTPNTSSSQYSGPITISSNSTVKAFALSANDVASPIVSATLTFTTGTPAISPAAGTYHATQTITLTDSAPSSWMYYTLDGSTPTVYSKYYMGPFPISQNTTVRVIADSHNHSLSPVTSAVYTVQLPANPPTFSVASGSYTSARSVLLASSTSGSSLYYTTDGSTPSIQSKRYSGALSVGQTTTVKAIAYSSAGVPSTVTTAAYTIQLPASSPVFSVASGKYYTPQTVTITDSTLGAVIHYTTDDSAPTTSSPVYSSPLQVTASSSFAAVAIAAGRSLSPVAKTWYTMELPTAIPAISPAPGTYSTIQNVSLTCSTPGAVIYYTVNGKYPTTSSTVYTGPFTATNTTSIQAIAAAPSYSTSTVAAASYTIVAPPPTILPSGGSFTNTAQVVLTSSTVGAKIYYTLDGSTPTTSSKLYSSPFTISPSHTGSQVVEALVVANGYLNSSNTESSFLINLPSGQLAETTISTTPVLAVPSEFLGLSQDVNTTQQIVGTTATGINTAYRNLLQAITTNLGGPLQMRVSADATDTSTIQSVGEPLAELASAVNLHYILGVDMLTNNSSLAGQETAAWISAIPQANIDAFEIGNEPDNYPNGNHRPSTYGYADYLPQFSQWQSSVSENAFTGAKVMAASTAGGGWENGLIAAIPTSSFNPQIVSQHWYPGSYNIDNLLAGDFLLLPSTSISGPAGYSKYLTAAHEAGLKFRMGEMNSVSDGGQPGLSNSFSSALWLVDSLFELLNRGYDGANIHSGQYTRYQLFQFSTSGNVPALTYKLTSVNPVYYGLLVFSRASGHHATLLPVSARTDLNVKTWATSDENGTIHIVVINKEPAASGDVLVNLPGYSTGTVTYLTAANYTSTSGVTWGGQTLDGSTDGKLGGVMSTSTINASNGVFKLEDMPVTSIALIDITK